LSIINLLKTTQKFHGRDIEKREKEDRKIEPQRHGGTEKRNE
jgi:hypothetical protein